MKMIKEPFLEPILRKMRIGKVLNEIKRFENPIILDIGCGFNHKFLSDIEPYIAHGTGIDFKIQSASFGKIRTIQATLSETLPFVDKSFDIVTMLAVLEHLDKPNNILHEIWRVLKDEGKLILTVPGKRAKFILEFLAFRLGVVSRSEIEDHKKYYDFFELKQLTDKNGQFEIILHKYFQLGANNFCIMKKKKQEDMLRTGNSYQKS